ncbi:MAG: hypothetical protein FWH12_06480 [Treponema sp.]|nr:hypothetical protein [Treponema sp.]
MGIGFNIIGRKIGEGIESLVKLVFEARKGDNRSALLYNSAGEDSVPLDNERLILAKIDGNGKYIAVGVLTLSQGANPGEKIYFSRDNKPVEDASIVAKISMLNDGSITIDTDTETTGEATGDYKRIIKGETKVIERKDRSYLNEANATEEVKKNYKHKSDNTDLESNQPMGIKGTETLLGADVLQVFFQDVKKAVNRNPVIIPPAPWPPGAPVPPVPPLINMHLKGVWTDIAAAADKAIASCKKALK